MNLDGEEPEATKSLTDSPASAGFGPRGSVQAHRNNAGKEGGIRCVFMHVSFSGLTCSSRSFFS